MRYFILLILFIFTANPLFSQNNKVKIFLDCSNVWCDQDYIRTEINIVDFLLDRVAADVHVLITSQSTGGGGREYQIIFFGQKTYSSLKDTLTFSTDPNSTEFERRDEILKNLKVGLVPFLIKNGSTKNITINMKAEKDEVEDTNLQKDPWNYWVFNIGADGNLSADKNYKNLNLSGNFSMNRTTDKQKIYFNGRYGKDKNVFEYNENGIFRKIIVNNHNYRLYHGWVFSIDDHWSYGYEASLDRNTFSNNQNKIFLQPAIEYSIFPYPEVNNKFLTFRYGIDYTYYNYYDSTIYNKTEESLLGHELEIDISFNQKWGNIISGIAYRNYFHNWSLNNLGMFSEIDLRITGGLSVYFYFSGEIVHDQLYLPKGGATEEEVLTRRRQLESNYNLFTYFGINYRFGSNLNNFVNPRFR